MVRSSKRDSRANRLVGLVSAFDTRLNDLLLSSKLGVFCAVAFFALPMRRARRFSALRDWPKLPTCSLATQSYQENSHFRPNRSNRPIRSPDHGRYRIPCRMWEAMPGWWRTLTLVLAAAGCHTSPAVAPRPAVPTVPPVSPELPLTDPSIPVLDGKGLPKLPSRTSSGPEGSTFRRLTESDCLHLAAANTGTANLLDEENGVPASPNRGLLSCDLFSSHANHGSEQRDRLRQTLRYHTAARIT